MGNFSFSDLNLGKVELSTGGTLMPGRHICKVSEAAWKDMRNGGKQIEVKLASTNGGGTIRHWLTVFHPTSETSMRIGREQLKSLLVHGGHNDPDNVGEHGIGSMKGLRVGVGVKPDSWTDDSGNAKEGSKVSYYYEPPEGEDDSAVSDDDNTLDDTIPF